MLVVPLIFSALALGVTGLGDLRHLGRVGLKTLVYTVVVSTIAVVLGVTLVNVLRPGEGLSPETRARMTEGAAARSASLAQRQRAQGGPRPARRHRPAEPAARSGRGATCSR